MRTTSINVFNLCIPCENRCRYCLLSYNGKLCGIDYKRSEAYAKSFYEWLKINRPDLSFMFYFGYSMEHPKLLEAIDFMNSIGSASGEFLQFDGMKFRSDDELRKLLVSIKAHGVNLIDLTFYGTQEYHDKFAARQGDYHYMTEILKQANSVGLDVKVGIPLTHENADQIDSLLIELEQYKLKRLFCFIPHVEGRGESLNNIRFSSEDYSAISEKAAKLLNRDIFRPEKEWVNTKELPTYEKRMLALSLTPENIDLFENQSFENTIAYLEKLDDDYYNTIPSFEELIKIYGDLNGDKFYSARDLYLNFQQRFIKDNNIDIYDINDERQCFSRRF